MIDYPDLAALSQNAPELAIWLFFSALKASVLLAGVYFTCRLFRHTSAAVRHFVLIAALLAGLLLPFISTGTSLEIAVLPARIADIQTQTTPAAEALEETIVETPPTPFPVSVWLIAIWLGVALFLLLRVMTGHMLAGPRARRAKPVKNAKLIELAAGISQDLTLRTIPELLVGKNVSTPVTCGIWRSKIILPLSFGSWSEERQRIVLLHEFAHIKRLDCLTQLLARVVCTIYWFNPLAWYAARYLCELREQACDDQVLNSGTRSSVYADHLLDIVRSLPQKRSVFDLPRSTSVAIARKCKVETRILSILDPRQSRGASNHLTKAAAILAVAIFALPLSALQLGSRQEVEASIDRVYEPATLTDQSEISRSPGPIAKKKPLSQPPQKANRERPVKKTTAQSVRLAPLGPLQSSLGPLRGELAPLGELKRDPSDSP